MSWHLVVHPSKIKILVYQLHINFGKKKSSQTLNQHSWYYTIAIPFGKMKIPWTPKHCKRKILKYSGRALNSYITTGRFVISKGNAICTCSFLWYQRHASKMPLFAVGVRWKIVSNRKGPSFSCNFMPLHLPTTAKHLQWSPLSKYNSWSLTKYVSAPNSQNICRKGRNTSSGLPAGLTSKQVLHKFVCPCAACQI